MEEYGWYEALTELAIKHDESVADYDAWIQCFHNKQTPEEAFYDEFPEHKEV